MAVNPLFTSYQHYTPVCCYTSQGFKMSRDSDQCPPEKRRRTEEEESKFDEMWDEDIEFSQADIQSLDVMASQAYKTTMEGSGNKHLQDSVSQGQPTIPVTVDFQQPSFRPTSKLSRKNSSSTSSLSLSRNASSSSSTLYPSTMSSRHSSDARSLSSSSSQSCLDSAKGDSKHPMEEIGALRSKIEALKKENSQATEQLCSRNGEIKMLRETLKKKDSDLAKLREDRLQSIDHMNNQRSAIEESFKTEAEKLQTQLQFREQEFKELEEKCRHMEQRLHASITGTPTKMSSPTQRSPLSRKVRPEVSPRSKSQFPSHKSFMADEQTVTGPVAYSSSGTIHKHLIPSFSSTDKTASETGANRSNVRKHVLNTNMKSGEATGPRLVDELFQQGSVDTADQGIVGLLHTPSTPLYIQHLQFDRDITSTILSPIRGQRLSDVHARLQHTESVDTQWVVPKDHFLMAIQGLRDLVSCPSHCSDCGRLPSMDQSVTEELSGAVLILPLINDYLSHYIDMLSNTSISVTSSSGTTNSSSLGKGSVSESSLESVTSSMGKLIKDCQTFANNLEYLALASLRTLLILVKFSAAVRRSLINRTDWNHNSTNSTPHVSAGSSASGEGAMDVDVGMSSSSDTDTMSLESRVTFQQLQQLNLLHKIAALAHPHQENYSVQTVEEALNIVIVLASRWSGSDHVRLHSALSKGVLSRCLECRVGDSSWGIIVRAVTVLCHLTTSQKVIQALCTKSDLCPLLHLYLVSLKLTDEVEWSTREVIYQQTVTCLSNLLMEPGSVINILANNCHCSAEAGRSLLTCLLHLNQHYEEARGHPAHVLHTLHNGLLLLHHCQQRQENYLTDRDWELQDEYVALICGLTSLFKHLPGNNEAELNALSDLWDFNQDDSELSPDSDQEEMDM